MLCEKTFNASVSTRVSLHGQIERLAIGQFTASPNSFSYFILLFDKMYVMDL